MACNFGQVRTFSFLQSKTQTDDFRSRRFLMKFGNTLV